MSEKRARYTVSRSGAPTLAEIKSWDSARLFDDPKYEQPTPAQVGGLLDYAGWSQVDAAKLVGASYKEGDGSNSIRRYKTESGNNARAIPYAAWRLLLLNAKVVQFEPAGIAPAAPERLQVAEK